MLNEIEKLAVINQKADVQMSSEPVHQLSLYLFFIFVFCIYLFIFVYILPLYSVFI